MKKKMKAIDENITAVVVLNYLNYWDTIECVDSLKLLTDDIHGIVIVDNGSTNESVKVLRDYYTGNGLVNILSLKKNVGFARGNNAGIEYARRKWYAGFILVLNNDTKILDKDYISKLKNVYDEKTAVIGSSIMLKNGSIQTEYRDTFELDQFFLQYLNLFGMLHGSGFDFLVDTRNEKKFLHGCAILFTPVFFRYYRGFYPHTFLYYEEKILYLMCMYKGMIQKYVSETVIYHKEDCSSEISFHNDTRIVNKFAFRSQKYVLLWIMKCKIMKKYNDFIKKWKDFYKL